MPRRSKIASLPKDLNKFIEQTLLAKNFSGYEALARAVRELGEKLGVPAQALPGKSALHRYGSALESRLAAIKASTEAAVMVMDVAPDDIDARSSAVMSMVQTEMFDAIMKLQEAHDADPQERVKLISAAAKHIATMTRASISLKRWQTEWRTKFAADLGKIETEARSNKLSAIEVIARIRGAYGLDQPGPATG